MRVLDARAENPIRVRARMQVGAPRDVVFAALADDVAGWGRWFPGFGADGHWVGPAPHGVGSTRVLTVAGRRFEETIVARVDHRHWGFVVARTDGPLLRSVREHYTFADDAGGGTGITWSGELDLGRLNVVLRPVTRALLPLLFRYVARRLTRVLTA
jgi:hypothetical protein